MAMLGALRSGCFRKAGLEVAGWGVRNRQDDLERVGGGWDDCEPDGRWYWYNELSLHRRGVPEADD